MDGVVYLTGKNYKLNLISLIGSFLLFIGIVSLFVNISNLTNLWSAQPMLIECYANSVDPSLCKAGFFEQTGVGLGLNDFPSEAQRVMLVLGPMVYVLWSLVLCLFGIFVYSLGHHIVLLDAHKVLEHKIREAHPNNKARNLPSYLDEGTTQKKSRK